MSFKNKLSKTTLVFTLVLLIFFTIILAITSYSTISGNGDEEVWSVQHLSETQDLLIKNNSNQRKLILYGSPENYWNETEYVPINSTVVSSNYKNYEYEMIKSIYSTYFNDNIKAGDSVRFEKEDYYFIYDLSGGKMQWAEQEGNPDKTKSIGSILDSTPYFPEPNHIRYNESFLDTDIFYNVQNVMLKENFVLNQLPSGGTDYLYLEYTGEIKYHSNLTVWANGEEQEGKSFTTNGKIEFKNQQNKTIFHLPSPTATDSNESLVSCKYDVKVSTDKIQFGLKTPKSFLDSAVFPVIIDPTIKLDDTSTEVLADVYSDDGLGGYEFQIKFGNLSAIPSTATINSADLCLYTLECAGSGCIDNDASFERVLDYGWEEGINAEDWNAQSTDTQITSQTWNNTESGLPFFWMCLNVTAVVEKDISGDNKNTTIRIEDVDYPVGDSTDVPDDAGLYIGSMMADIYNIIEDRENTFFSGNTPYLVIDYTETGDETPPSLTILNPANASVYTWYDGIDLNVTANENISTCQYSIEGNANITMDKENATKWGSSNTTAFSGSTKVVFSCNDTINNWNSTIRYFTGNVSANSSRCGEINSPLTLTADVDMNGLRDCFEFTTNELTLDCGGYLIGGVGNHTGIYSNEEMNLTIKNCKVNFWQDNIKLEDGDSHIIINNTITNATRDGIRASGTVTTVRYYLNVSDNLVKDCGRRALSFSAIQGSVFNYNDIVSNNPNNTEARGIGIYIYQGDFNNITGNNISHNYDGIYLEDISGHSERNTITENWIYNSSRYGINLDNSSYNYVQHNSIFNATDNLRSTAGAMNNSYFNNTLKNPTRACHHFSTTFNFTLRQENCSNSDQYGIILDSNYSGGSGHKFYDSAYKSVSLYYVRAKDNHTSHEFINVSFASETYFIANDTSFFDKEWYLTTYCELSNGSACNQANISLDDKDSTFVQSELTSSAGFTTRWEVSEYNQTNSSRNYKSLYSINASGISGYNTNVSTLNLTTNTNFTIYLSQVDSTPPLITIIKPTNTTHSSSTLDFNVTVNEDASLCQYSLDGDSNVSLTKENATAWGKTVSSISEGSRYVIYSCNDTSDNWNSSESRYFTVDTVPPILYIDHPTNTSYTTTNTTFNYTATDTTSSISTCWYSIDNGVTNTTIENCLNITFTASEGSTNLTLYANDTVANENLTSVTFYVDTIIPGITIQSPDNSTYESSSVSFNVSVNEEASACWYNNGSSSNFTLTELNATYFYKYETGLADGSYWVEYYCNDTLNNENKTGKRYFTVTTPDTISPYGFLIYPGNGSYYEGGKMIFEFNATDDTDLKNATMYTWNLSVNSEFSATPYITNHTNLSGTFDHRNLTWDFQKEGYFKTSILIYDTAENSNWTTQTYSGVTTTNVSFAVDIEAPYFSSGSPYNMTIEYNTQLGQQVNATDDIIGIGGWNVDDDTNFSINGSGWFSNETLLSVGIYWVNITVWDTYFAHENISMIYVNVTDSTPPEIYIDFPENTTYETTLLSLNWSVIEPNLDSCQYSLNSESNISLVDESQQDAPNIWSDDDNWDTTYSASNTVDSNWTTYGITTNTQANVYENYTIPASATSANWTYKIYTATAYAISYYWNNTASDWQLIYEHTDIGDNTYTEFIPLDGLDSSILQLRMNVTNSTVHNAKYYEGRVDWYGTGSYNTTFLGSEGSNTIIVSCNDTSNNENSTSVIFYVDSIIPGITIQSPDNSTYNSSSVSFNVSINEEASACWYNNGSSSNFTLTELNTTYFYKYETGLGDGSHFVEYYCNDTLNNENKTGKRYFTITTDAIPPELYIDLPANTTYSSTNITFNYTVIETNIDSCWYNNKSNANYTLTDCANITFTGIEGNNQIELYANDTAGNENKSGIRYYTITIPDSTPPILTVINPANASVYTWYDGIDLNVTANENISTCQYSIEGNVNITMNKENATKWGSSNTTAFSGSTKVTFSCNDTSNNWNSTIRYFTGNVSANSSRCGKVYGDLTLIQDVNMTNLRDCFEITNWNCVLDCDGYSIEGLGVNYGIFGDYLDNIIIKNCKINNWKYGILIQYDSNNDLIENVTISNCTRGIRLNGSPAAILTNITVSNSTFIDNSEYSISGDEFYNSTIISNTISSPWNGIAGCGVGIYVYEATENNITKNSISHCHDSIYINDNDEKSQKNTISENYIYNSTRYGIRFDNSSFNYASHNSIVNSSYGIRVSTSAQNVSFFNNTILNADISCYYFSTIQYLTIRQGNCTNSDGYGASFDSGLNGGNYTNFYDSIFNGVGNFSLRLQNNHQYHKFINCSFNNISAKVLDTSFYDRQWYLTTYCELDNGSVCNQANISLDDKDSTFIQSELSSSEGYTSRWEISEYNETSSGKTYKSLYSINASGISGYSTNVSTLNLTTNTNFTIYLSSEDSTPPLITIIKPTNITHSISTLDFNVTINEDASYCQYSLDGGVNISLTSENATAWGKEVSDISEGSRYVIYSCNDTSDNWNSTTKRYFTVDTIFPTINFTDPTPGNGSTITINSVYVNYTTSDANEIYSFIDFDNSLVGWWRLDNDASIGENATHVYDWSRNNNGTVYYDATPTASGKFGGGFTFDGYQDKITIPDDSFSGDFVLNISGEITMSAWIYMPTLPTENSHDYTILSKRHNGDTGYGFRIRNATGSDANVLVCDFKGLNDNYVDTSIPLIANTWYFVACVYNGTHILAYLNGTLDTSNPSTGNISTNPNYATIGKHGSIEYFNGTIDEVMIFNRSLSSEEINALYNSSKTYHNFTSLSDGTYTAKSYVVDIAGNKNETETRYFTVSLDTTSPYGYLIYPGNGSYYEGGKMIFEFNATDDISLKNATMYTWNLSVNSEFSATPYITNYTNISGTFDHRNLTWDFEKEGYFKTSVLIYDTSGNSNWTTQTYAGVTITNVSFAIDIEAPYFLSGSPYNMTIEYNTQLGQQVNATDDIIGIGGWSVNDTENFGINNSGWLSNETLLSLGMHWVNISVWDTSFAHTNTSVIYVNVTDTTPPEIYIDLPANTTYPSTNITLNYTVSDVATSVSSCWYSLNSGSNISLPSCDNTTFIGIEGADTIQVFANDTYNNENKSAMRYFTISVITPTYSNNFTIPESPITYPTGIIKFNITWSDQSDVWYFFNGTNYTNLISSANQYEFNRTDLGVGIYYYEWYANATSGKENKTGKIPFTVNPLDDIVDLYLNNYENQNISVAYPTETNATGVSGNCTANIYRDSVVKANPEIITLGIGNYNYTVTSTCANYNYSSNTTGIYYYLTVNQTDSGLYLKLNDQEANVEISYGTESNATAEAIPTIILLRNGTIVTPTENKINITLGVGKWNYTAYFEDTTNYSGISTISRFLNITQAITITNLTLDGSEENISITYPSTFIPITWSDFAFPTLYRDGSNVSTENGTSVLLGGNQTYNYTGYTTGNANYSSSYKTWFVNISINTTILTSIVSPNLTTYGTTTYANCTSNNGIIPTFLRNSILTASPENVILGVGEWNYSCNYTGNANYSSSTSSMNVTITQASGDVNLYLDGSQANTSIDNRTHVNITTFLVTGLGNITIYLNYSLIANGTSPLYNNYINSTPAIYNVTSFYPGNTNYTSAYETWWLTITAYTIPSEGPPGGAGVLIEEEVRKFNITKVETDICNKFRSCKKSDINKGQVRFYDDNKSLVSPLLLKMRVDINLKENFNFYKESNGTYSFSFKISDDETKRKGYLIITYNDSYRQDTIYKPFFIDRSLFYVTVFGEEKLNKYIIISIAIILPLLIILVFLIIFFILRRKKQEKEKKRKK